MILYNIYFLDFCFRLIYCFFSYLICWGLFFSNSSIVFLFESIPLINALDSKRLILTQISHLFDTIWFYSIFLSWICIYPLIMYHIESFNRSGWYSYQLIFYRTYAYLGFFWFIILYFLIHYIIVPKVVAFFLLWEIKDNTSLLRVESEIALFYYVIWSLIFKFKFAWFLSTIFLLLIIFVYFLNLTDLYKLAKKFKKLIYFCIICFLFFLIPPDFIIQVFLVVTIYTLIELYFLSICVKLYNKINNVKLKIYANNKTTT